MKEVYGSNGHPRLSAPVSVQVQSPCFYLATICHDVTGECDAVLQLIEWTSHHIVSLARSGHRPSVDSRMYCHNTPAECCDQFHRYNIGRCKDFNENSVIGIYGTVLT